LGGTVTFRAGGDGGGVLLGWRRKGMGIIPEHPLRSNYLSRDVPHLSVDSLLAIIQVLRSYDLAI
jgi:hypothetical protein